MDCRRAEARGSKQEAYMGKKTDEDMENSRPQEEHEPGLEERFAAIEEILDHMEEPDVSLEQSFAMYRRGLAELNAANRMLDDFEKAMLVMTEDGSLEEF